MMKFIAVTTGYGRAGCGAAGFQSGGDSKAEDYAQHLLELTVNAWLRCKARSRSGCDSLQDEEKVYEAKHDPYRPASHSPGPEPASKS